MARVFPKDPVLKAQILNYEVKAIETFLAIPFEGETIEEMEEFVQEHYEERTNYTKELLREAYEETKEDN